MRIRNALFSLTVALAAPAAGADMLPDRIMIPLASAHPGIDGYLDDGIRKSFTEVNPGLAMQWEKRTEWQLDFVAGAYRNSFAGLSAFGYTAKLWDIEASPISMRAGPFLGLASYGRNARFIDTEIGNTGVVGIGGLKVQIGGAFATVTPQYVDRRLGAVIGFGVSIPTRM